MSEPSRHLQDERRRFFRIDDELVFFYRKIDEVTANRMTAGTQDILGNASLTAALDVLSQESSLLMRRIERNQPDIADYLKVLENKIELLVRAFMTQGMNWSQQEPSNVNLSASGIAFECAEAMAPGEFLEIKMLLASSMSLIVAVGRVVHCTIQTQDGGAPTYLIAVDYYNMHEQDREFLIKHVVKRQLQQLRQHKAQQET